MLLTQSSFFSLPALNLSLGKNPNSTKPNRVSLFGTNGNNILRSSGNNGKLGVSYNGNTYNTSPHQSEVPLQAKSIGIDEFFQGKNIFITGATGLVGKALVEKLLRSTSIGKIYLLVKANNKEAAIDRLSNEIINSNLFESIREKHGKFYEEFVRERLIPVLGNICEPNLGMDAYSMNAIMNQVDVIIESAAGTTLNDRYDVLIDLNTNAPLRLMRFAKRCKNLKIFVHISTAYVGGRREGVILENPLVMGEHWRKEDDHHVLSYPGVDLTDEMNLAIKSCLASKACDATKELKRLGMERAAFLGWSNSYQLTKAMGEMVVNETRGDVPVLIIRPSVVESTYNEPFPGWIQGNRMFDPVIISYGKGQLPGYLADPNEHMDIIPVDMVANTTIAAIAKHGVLNKPQMDVYHVAADFVNPLRYSDFFEYIYQHFNANPLSGNPSRSIAKIKFFDEFSDFSKYVRQEISDRNGMRHEIGSNGNITLQKMQKQYKAKVAYAENLCKMYEFLGFIKARFHTGNMRKLLEEMSKEEQANFEIDATKIDWRKYFTEIHIPGLRKHVLNESATLSV